MADSISCPHCRHLLHGPDDYDGGEVRCPQCQQVFVVGAPTGITAQTPVPLAEPATTGLQTGMPSGAGASRWTAAAEDDPDARKPIYIGRAFKPGGSLARAVMVLLALNLLLDVVSLGSYCLQYRLATRLVGGAIVPQTELDSNDARQQILGITHTVLYLGTAIVFLVWFHRAYANLPALSARHLSYTAGWAAGSWFVPFMNLWRPVQIAQEIWRNSDPAANAGASIQVEPSANSVLIGCWWAMWLITNVISNISVRMEWAINSPHSLQTATAAGMVAEVASIVAAALALAVVAAIDARQTACAEAPSALGRLDW